MVDISLDAFSFCVLFPRIHFHTNILWMFASTVTTYCCCGCSAILVMLIRGFRRSWINIPSNTFPSLLIACIHISILYPHMSIGQVVGLFLLRQFPVFQILPLSCGSSSLQLISRYLITDRVAMNFSSLCSNSVDFLLVHFFVIQILFGSLNLSMSSLLYFRLVFTCNVLQHDLWINMCVCACVRACMSSFRKQEKRQRFTFDVSHGIIRVFYNVLSRTESLSFILVHTVFTEHTA
jgi:hypothetical protein